MQDLQPKDLLKSKTLNMWRPFLRCLRRILCMSLWHQLPILTWELHQMNVKIKFLDEDLEEEVYMNQYEGFLSSDGEHLVCKLKKFIQGLKQVSCRWYFKFHHVISSFSFEENIMDQYKYHKISGSKIFFLILYVNDILLATNDRVTI